MKVYKTIADGIQIVEYDDSLAQAIADMWNKSGDGWGGSFGNGVFTAEQVISDARGAYFNIYIAMNDGEAVGFCSLNRYYKDENTAYVQLLNVRPDYHGKKIGKELVLACVEETIARKMPRLDIHTWPGNTKAMPLYKKCGFFWEDRADTTLLSNFIPTVLSTDLIKDFFIAADWYADSTRVIDTEPDGKKVDKFELYEYSWEKNGAKLRVGFEKSGRRMNLIETDDYLVEMTAPNHELAYGISYPCTFNVKNKSGKNLDVTIIAKNDDVISFEGSWSENVSDEASFEGMFSVGAITEELDKMRVHPCVLADVSINGKTAEFGLGIEPMFPININLAKKEQIAKAGLIEEVYIDLTSNLSADATIKFTLPDNPLLQFAQSEFEAKIESGKSISLPLSTTVLSCGYVDIPVEFEIKMNNGDIASSTRQLHIVNQGLSEKFGFETNSCFGAASGLWRLKLNKNDNEVMFDRILKSGHCEFFVTQIGKPYTEELETIRPSDVRVTENDAAIKFEADYISGKFPGAVYTAIYSFDSTGALRYNYKITNTGASQLDLFVKTQFWGDIGKRVVYPYDGEIHEVADKTNYGFDSLHFDKIDENWIFDAGSGSASGIYWSEKYKPTAKWGDVLVFEVPTGNLSPGQAFESEPFVYMCDIFKTFHDFRNYVRNISEGVEPFKHNHLEIITNGGNPVVSGDSFKLSVKNNRLNIHEGTVRISSPDGAFSEQQQTNPADELRIENAFTVQLDKGSSGVNNVAFTMCLDGVDMEKRRALLITNHTELKTTEKNDIFTVENGKIRFKVSPSFLDNVYSLQYDDNEWLFSNYPSLDSYSWWNPFAGGIKTTLEKMAGMFVQREKVTAAFTTEVDKLGNTWSGIRTDMSIENFDEYKGLTLSQFYLTLPGVPVLCHFVRIHNETGRYLDRKLFSTLMLRGKDDLSEIHADMMDEQINLKVRPGIGDEEMKYDRFIAITHDKGEPRPESLYIYNDTSRDKGTSYFEYDLNAAYCTYENIKAQIPNGKSHTTMPILCVFADKELTLDDMTDFSRIVF
ncbi:MAG: GNAT family N-acetyltransferase [Oscillospiraceae bacterium]|nr:GNAT family N-acetyltransferase [Oscillospiraceae bacterium]